MINRFLCASVATLSLVVSGVLKADTVDKDSLSIDADSVIGNNIGHFIDQQDKSRILQSLKSGDASEPTAWKSDKSGIAFTVTPDSVVRSEQKTCRDFTLKTSLGTFLREFPGTACRQDDGRWVVMK